AVTNIAEGLPGFLPGRTCGGGCSDQNSQSNLTAGYACGFFVMIIVLKPNISKKDETAVIKEIKKLGYKPHIMRGVAHTVIGAIGDERTHQTLEPLATWKQVESVMPVQKRYKLVSREAHRTGSTIDVRGNIIGGKKIQIMA